METSSGAQPNTTAHEQGDACPTSNDGNDDQREHVPSRQRRRFPGISSRAYEHPADRSALVALRKLSGFDTVFKALSGLLPERSLRLLFLSDSVRVSDEQFAHLNDMLRDACYILDLEKVPPMYVNQDPQPNAMCIGLDEPIIVVTTGLVELLDEEEMRAVVGHEVGHALSGHSVYRTILLFLTNLALRSPGSRSATSRSWRSSRRCASGSASRSCPRTAPGCWSARTSRRRCAG